VGVSTNKLKGVKIMNNQKLSMLVTLLIALLLPGTNVYAQFTAKMLYTMSDKSGEFQIFSDGSNYRYEFNEDGQEGVVIVPKDAKQIFILMPQQKMAIKTISTSQMSMGRDPLKQYEYWLNEGATEEIVGTEKINGIECIKKELRNVKKDEYGEVNQHLFTIWYSEEYKFPVKMENYIDGSNSSGMELSDIEAWTPNADSFKVPDGYKMMEM